MRSLSLALLLGLLSLLPCGLLLSLALLRRLGLLTRLGLRSLLGLGRARLLHGLLPSSFLPGLLVLDALFILELAYFALGTLVALRCLSGKLIYPRLSLLRSHLILLLLLSIGRRLRNTLLLRDYRRDGQAVGPYCCDRLTGLSQLQLTFPGVLRHRFWFESLYCIDRH